MPLSSEQHEVAPSCLFEFAVDAWLADLAATKSPQTVTRYRKVLTHVMTWFIAQEHRPLMLNDLTPMLLVSYRRQQQQIHATSTVNVAVCALRMCCAWLTEQGWIEHNPAVRLKTVKKQPPLAPKGLDGAALDTLLRQAEHTDYPERNVAILHMLVQTGMRIGECAALFWQDILLSERSGWVFIRSGKGDKARKVPLNLSARHALIRYGAVLFGVEPTSKVVMEACSRTNMPLWKSHKKGKQLSASAIRQMIDLLVRLGAARGKVPPETSAHTLRHTFATIYLRDNPGDLVGLATILGHASLNTTRIYTQPSEADLEQRIERMALNAYG